MRLLFCVATALFIPVACQRADAPAPRRAADTAAGSATTTATLDTASAAAFAREFYRSYMSRASASGLAATDSLIAEQPQLFGDSLLAELRRDGAARAVATGEIDGLDGDPFLNSQDPCPHYGVGAVIIAGGVARVPVYAQCGARVDTLPAVTLLLAPRGSSWEISNVLYPAPQVDLLSHLRQLHPPAA